MGVNVTKPHTVWADSYAESKAVDLQHYADWVRNTAMVYLGAYNINQLKGEIKHDRCADLIDRE